MAAPPGEPREEPVQAASRDETVPHEDSVDAAVDAQLRRTSTHATIEPLAPPSAAYVEAEAVAMAATINSILEVLMDAELLPAPAPPEGPPQ